jgi:DNA primase
VEQLSLQGQLELRVLHLPTGKDPDEFLKDHGAGDYRALLDQAPLWLDWQIEQALADRDLSRADQFQQAVSSLVALLGKLPQSAVRTHYLQRVAERLSGGQGRLALQLEEDLRQQVKGSVGMADPAAMSSPVRSASGSGPKPICCGCTCIALAIEL